ncbi:MAG: hypothetical protein Q8N51_16040, partial [Gammaproteobacteria bacterium]|nr:hypothetical protein [Gammaproteobacteria bacterium]
MGMFNDVDFLGGFIFDAVTDALMQPTSAIPVLEAGVVPLTSVCLLTGPRPLYITNLQVLFQDIVVVDPAADRYLGWAIWSASDGSGAPTYASLKGKTAAADLPQILVDATPTALLATANIPYDLFSFVGGAANTSIATAQTDVKQGPVRVAAKTLFQVRL